MPGSMILLHGGALVWQGRAEMRRASASQYHFSYQAMSRQMALDIFIRRLKEPTRRHRLPSLSIGRLCWRS